MVVMASDGPSPHSPSLRFGLPAPQPSRRHHAQSLLGPSFHDSDPRTHHVLESHPERAAPLSRRDDERCHALVSHSVFCTAPPSCNLQPLLKLSLLSLRPSLLQFGAVDAVYVDAFLAAALTRVMRAAVPIPAVACAFVLHSAAVGGSVVGVVGPL